MAKATEDTKSLPANAPDGGAVPPAMPKEAENEKSWGDKYKVRALNFKRNVAVNFVTNFAISALLTYGVIKSPWNASLEKGIRNVAEFGNRRMGVPTKLGEFVGEFFTRTQILLCGGHSLLPYMNYSHNHRREMEFETGHQLDTLQQKLGRGNAATRRNLEEYKYIKDLMAANRPRDLTDADKTLLSKHNIGDNLQFNERRQPVKQLLKARAVGMTATTALSAVFGVGSYYGTTRHIPWIDIKETYLKRGGGAFAEKFLPGLKHVGLKDVHLFGQIAVLELIYTGVSKLGFDHIEKRQRHNQERADQAEAQAQLKGDKAALGTFGQKPDSAPPATSFAARKNAGADARRRLVENGAQDFRARESAKTSGETGVALT